MPLNSTAPLAPPPAPYVDSPGTLVSWVVLLGAAVLVVSPRTQKLTRALVRFVWACFLKPMVGKLHKDPKVQADQQQHLDQFYLNQAHIYDSTRAVLLKGRKECLQLAVLHLQSGRRRRTGSKLVWVDIGGGTGLNIEYMHSILPIADNFHAIYLVDLSHSLCEVARKRFEGTPWRHKVHVLETDASDFAIVQEHADLVTFSYSLLMIPSFNAVVDHAHSLLSPTTGVVACVDFGVQSAETSMGRTNTLGGSCKRNSPWFLRHFWRIWFETDKVYLDLARRNYLEYRFGTVKSFNAYNNSLGRIPYYVWVGCHKDRSLSLVHKINCLATESPYLAPSDETQAMEYALPGSDSPIKGQAAFPGSDSPIKDQAAFPISKGHEAALFNLRRRLPYPSLYYQQQPWRVYYDEVDAKYHQFGNQYIYAFTWEDPREDHRILKFSRNDTVLAITLAGDNVLLYAGLADPPRKIHAVDLNPCQNHLLELKLAAFKCLTREQIWAMFGEGKIAGFTELLLLQLAPHMSSQAFQYWMDKGPKAFSRKGLYDTGSTRWALRLARGVFALFGISSVIDDLCNCTDLLHQIHLWETKIRPTLFNPFVATLLVGNPIFLWKALGVPQNQAEMIGDSVLKYVINTLDPAVRRCLISSDNYFYYLTLQGKYSRQNCPDYLTDKGYANLTSEQCINGESVKKPEENSNPSKERGQASDLDSGCGLSPIDNIRLHTDTLNDVFARLSKKSITIAIIMDHMDWFDPKKDDATTEILALRECLAPGGRVMLRSAAQYPWYIKRFEKCGFKCKPAAIRRAHESIDRINMYASTWVCTKIESTQRRRMSSLKI